MKKWFCAKVLCWLLIFPLVGAVLYYPFFFWHYWGAFGDGNAYTDPIAEILSCLTPVAVVGVSGLAILWRYGLASRKHFVIAAATVLFFTLAPLIFGLWLWHEWNLLFTFSFSYWAWWLAPVNFLWLSAYGMSLVTLKAALAGTRRRLITLVIYALILLFLGSVLAWNSMTQNFALSLVNLMAVIPFTVACAGLIWSAFIMVKQRSASRQ